MKGILPGNVIFFDGFCILCSGFVEFIIKHDRSGSFKFCPLQSETAKLALANIGYSTRAIWDLDNVVYVRNGELKTKSDAAFTIFFVFICVIISSITVPSPWFKPTTLVSLTTVLKPFKS